MITWHIGECVVRVFPDRHYLETVFPDGTKVPAAPEDTDAYRATAAELGYGEDTWKCCQEHELLHSLAAVHAGHPWSRVLWQVAHPDQPPILTTAEVAAEEADVLSAQRLTNHIRRHR